MINGYMGLGIVLTMRDYASMPAGRLQRALIGLDQTTREFSFRFTDAMYQLREGMNMMATGVMALAAPIAIVTSTFESMERMGELMSLGFKNQQIMYEKSLEYTNKYAGTMRSEFIHAAYTVKDGLEELSDEAVAEYTYLAGITAKATKATIDEMTELFTEAHHIFKMYYGDIDEFEFGEKLSGGLTAAIKIFKAQGTDMKAALSQASAIPSVMGMPMEEQLTFLGFLINTMSGPEAGTRIKEFARKAAMAAPDLEAIGVKITDTNGKLIEFYEIIKRLRDHFGPMTSEVQAALKKIFGTRYAGEVFSFFWNVSEEEWYRKLNMIKEGMDQGRKYAEEMAETIDENLSRQLQILWQQIKNLAEIIGFGIGPNSLFMPLVKGIQKLVLAVQEIAKANPNIFKFWAIMTMLTGSFLLLSGLMSVTIGLFKLIHANMFLVRMRAKQLAFGIRSLVWAFGPLVLAIIGAYLAFKNNFGGIKDIIDSAENKLFSFVKKVSVLMRALKEAFYSQNGLYGLFDTGRYGYLSADTVETLNELGLMPLFSDLVMISYRIIKLLEGISEGFSGFIDITKKVANVVGNLLNVALKPLLWILGKLGVPVDNLTNMFSGSSPEKWEAVGKAIGMFIAPLLMFKAFGKAAGTLGRVKTYAREMDAWLSKRKQFIESAYSIFGGRKGSKGSRTQIRKLENDIKLSQRKIKEWSEAGFKDQARIGEKQLKRMQNQLKELKGNQIPDDINMPIMAPLPGGGKKTFGQRVKDFFLFPFRAIGAIAKAPFKALSKIALAFDKMAIKAAAAAAKLAALSRVMAAMTVIDMMDSLKNVFLRLIGLRKGANAAAKSTGLLSRVIKFITTPVKLFVGAVKNLALAMWTLTRTILVFAWRALVAASKGLLSLIRMAGVAIVLIGRTLVAAFVRAGQAALAFAIRMFLNPLGLIVLGVLVLIGLIIYLATHWEEVKEWGTKTFDKIKDAIDNAGRSINNFLTDLITSHKWLLKIYEIVSTLTGTDPLGLEAKGYIHTGVNEESNIIDKNTRKTINNVTGNKSGAKPTGVNLESSGAHRAVPPITGSNTTHITVPVSIDGREVARATATYVDRENRRG